MRWAFVFGAAGYILMMIVILQAVIVFNGLAVLALICMGLAVLFACAGGRDEHHD